MTAASGLAGVAQVVLSLVFILGLVVALAWMAQRLRLTPRSAAGVIRVLGDLPVGPKERVLLLQVGDRQALVGVGADGVRALSLLEVAVGLPPPPTIAEPVNLAARLRAVMEQAGAQRRQAGAP
jgi:flagellar protein FliO/FliZ